VSDVASLAELAARLGRCPDLDTLVSVALAGVDDLLGYRHSMLLLLDEEGARLYTLASHGYAAEGVGSEVRLGEGVIGMCGARSAPMRVANLGKMLRYARRIREEHEAHVGEAPGIEIPLPGLPEAESQLAVPAMALGQLVGVLAVESLDRLAFDEEDEARLTIVAGLIASAVEVDAAEERLGDGRALPLVAMPAPVVPATATLVRCFDADGSVFLDGDYLIKGVAGRLLRVLLGHHQRDGRVDFTNREVRLDPALELPEFRDNFESRLILLKRRLEEREAPVRITKTGRGRFRLDVAGEIRLEDVGA
jgi:adenylate cyclase